MIKCITNSSIDSSKLYFKVHVYKLDYSFFLERGQENDDHFWAARRGEAAGVVGER